MRRAETAPERVLARTPGCYHSTMSAPATLTPPTIHSSGVAREVEYPYSDGQVLMDADPHANAIVAMRNQLQWHFERELHT